MSKSLIEYMAGVKSREDFFKEEILTEMGGPDFPEEIEHTDAEARLLQAFTNFMRDISNIKLMLDRNQKENKIKYAYESTHQELMEDFGNYETFKIDLDEPKSYINKKVNLKKKLYILAMHKLKDVHKILKDTFLKDMDGEMYAKKSKIKYGLGPATSSFEQTPMSY